MELRQIRLDANESYQLWSQIAEGRLCVAVTAESFDRAQKIIKSAYFD